MRGRRFGLALRRPSATERRALARESLIWSLPAALALAGLAASGQVGGLTALLAWLASLVAGGVLARGRLRELEAIAAWIEGLPREQGRPPLEDAAGALSGRLLRPVAELGRQLRRQSGRMAAQQRMLASVIEAVPDPILVVDRELTVLQANAAARRSFDAPAAGPVPLARVLRDPGVLAAVNGALAGSAATGVTFSPTHDRTKQFSSWVEPVDLGEGGRGALLALREQTEQVMIERMRSDFVANASHEIRTPLASIQGFIETLRGPARHDPQARDAFLEVMAEEAARMARLVDDLLSLSRIELAANQPPRERCDPRDALLLAVERMRPAAEKARAALELEIEADLPSVTGDADQLHQLFVNLIDNAIKYGGEGKTVRVAAEALAAAPADSGPAAGRPCVRVRVADQGPGIAREHLPRLTERFYRVETGRSRRQRGTGLGLAIVKHILRRHQGHLAVESEPGAGSTFSVLLPVAPADAPASPVVTALS
ncbi:MAG TPA: ATP-binding protein [Geminicoccaceae bacterium]|nr:ATP-binding protein [Geminicoccaceae bacterium]